MNLVWAAGGAVAGVVTGAALRGTVFRLSVPAGEPDRVACPHCGGRYSGGRYSGGRYSGGRYSGGRYSAGPLRLWPDGWCGQCGRTLGTPVALELTTAVVLAALFGWSGGQPDVIAFGFLGALGVALAAIDLAVQRLPDRLTLPAYPLLAAMLAAAALAGHDLAALGRALLGGLALGACYLLLALVRPGQIGGGDIKLAGLVGLVLGWLGWPAVLVGGALGFVLAAVASLGLLAAGRVTMRSSISFGPYLLGGALLAVLASTHLGSHVP